MKNIPMSGIIRLRSTKAVKVDVFRALQISITVVIVDTWSIVDRSFLKPFFFLGRTSAHALKRSAGNVIL